MAVSFDLLLRQARVAVLLALGAGVFVGSGQASERGDVIIGAVRVIDGDSFEVAGTKIRLHGIDAPESDQLCQTAQQADWSCGGWITRVVTDRYSGQIARCEAVELDRYGRTVARCTALGEDVGAWLVAEGFAFAYVQYSTEYVEIERRAAVADRGLHAVQMMSPAEHRKAKRAQPVQVNGDCNIKGNISAKSERIYHVPGQEFYSRTRINTAKGERWFCSEAAARAAGWRRARR